MNQQTAISDFIVQLAAERFEHSFNPYADVCPVHDAPEAPAIRQANLRAVLTAACTQGVSSLWVARDLGYRGGRRTGLALTDELHLSHHAKLLQTAPLHQATRGVPMGERTATILWDFLMQLEAPVFLWNVFPFHPHAPAAPMTNRCHTRQERLACTKYLTWLLETLRPQKIVAIGRDAQVALEAMGIAFYGVRHPSYGGQTEFLTGLSNLYEVGVPSPFVQGQIPYDY